MVTYGREVVIVLDPFFVAETLAKGFLQAVDGFIRFSEERVGTGDIVKDRSFLGVHGQGAVSPFEGARAVAEVAKSNGAHVDGARIVGVELEMAFHRSQTISACLAGFFQSPVY